jgi:hypothetical protein
VVVDPDTVPKSISTPEGLPEIDEAAAKRLPNRARAHKGVLATHPVAQSLVLNFCLPEENTHLPNFPDLPSRAANMMQDHVDERSGDRRVVACRGGWRETESCRRPPVENVEGLMKPSTRDLEDEDPPSPRAQETRRVPS